MTRTATTTELTDGTGRSFAEMRLLLSERVSDWPKTQRIRLNARKRWKFMDELHKEWDQCWDCDRTTGLGAIIQVHHLTHGAFRSDERTALMPLCLECHQSVPGRLAELLWLKWYFDRENLSWLRLTMIAGRWLPDPKKPRELCRPYP
jgi:hypothetical protein